MKKIIILCFISFWAFGQKDTVVTTKKVVKFNDTFWVETKVISTNYVLFDARLMQNYESNEQEQVRMLEERTKKEEERKELVKLMKQAIRDGYVPKSDNDADDKLYKRVLDKVKKEKL